MKFKSGDSVRLSEEGANIRIPEMRRWHGTIDGWHEKFNKYWVVWKRCEFCNSPTKRWLATTEDLILDTRKPLFDNTEPGKPLETIDNKTLEQNSLVEPLTK